MKKRLPFAIAALCFTLLGIALALPRTHYAIQGWFRGEAYFAGQPTSYWLAAIKKDPYIGDQGDVFKKLGEAGPVAVPVLCQLFMDEDKTISTQAYLAMRFMDWKRHGMTVDAAEALVSLDSLDMFHSAVGELSAENRLTLKERLAEELKDKTRPKSRAAAAFALAWLGSDNQSELLPIAMMDGTTPVRIHAATLLWYSKQHTEEVLRTLVAGWQSPEPKIRRLASTGLKSIGRLANDALLSAVIGFLRSNDPSVREDATAIIAAMVPNENATNALLQAIQDEDALVRYEASLALANEKVHIGKKTIPILLAALEDSREARPNTKWRFSTGRSNVVRILGRLGGEDKAVLDALIRTLQHDNDTLVRITAVSTLATLSPRSSDVVNALGEAVRHDGDVIVRTRAAYELKQMGRDAEPALPALTASLQQELSAGIQSSVASAIAEIVTKDSQLECLLVALKDRRKESVRVAAAEALGQTTIRSGKIVAGLIAALEDDSVPLRLASAGSLARVDPGNPATIRGLRELLASRDKEKKAARPNDAPGVAFTPPDVTRDRAIRLLVRLGPAAKPALPELIGLLEEDQIAIRLHAIEALAAIGPDAKAALPKIKEDLKNPDLACRYAAAQALWRIDRNAELVVPVLIDALNEKPMNWWNVSAISTLSEIGPPAKGLRELSADADPGVQKAAREALAKTTGEPAAKGEPEVRTAAPGRK